MSFITWDLLYMKIVISPCQSEFGILCTPEYDHLHSAQAENSCNRDNLGLEYYSAERTIHPLS